MNAVRVVFGVALFLVWIGSPAWAQEQKLPEDVQKSRQKLEDHLKGLKGGAGAQILWLGQEPLPQLLPNFHFFAARYRVYPVGRMRPAGFAPSNVFAVAKDGTLTQLKDGKALQEFLNKNASAVKDEKTARDMVKACLYLTQEFRQDGFYKFSIIDESIKADALKEASGKAVVMQGGNGELIVTLSFDGGKVTAVAESGKIKRGPRPICQATKLLDADPIVRKMAEEDLLIMGLAARDYLMEQRAAASPALRQAIDRLWQRIVEEGW